MRVVLDEIGDHGLFFLDSRTSAQSIACQEARRMGVPCVANRLFLDHDGHSRKAIRDHLREAMRIALETHEVLVIGHAYPETYEVLYEAREEFEEKGLRLVTVSELLSPREVLYSGRMPGSQHD
jgi:polysaccharide deacetylase 2 family uncharacterized protein YibQ